MQQISIVIPVYGQWHLVKKNVDSNLQYDDEYIKEIIVVDDCSHDVNPYTFPDKVRVIRNTVNLRYSGTVNVGLKNASSPIIVLLDSDAYPTNSYIPRLLEIYKDDCVGCVGFATVDEKGNSTGNFDYEPSLLEFIAGQKMNALFKPLFIFNKKQMLPFSCAVSFRKSCLTEMNYLDDKTFPVLDADHDLSMRIHGSQWKLIFEDRIKIFHKGGSSIPHNHNRVLLYHESRWRLLSKFELLGSPLLAKQLLVARVKAEIMVFRLLLALKPKDRSINEEKLKGRKELLLVIKRY